MNVKSHNSCSFYNLIRLLHQKVLINKCIFIFHFSQCVHTHSHGRVDGLTAAKTLVENLIQTVSS